MEELNESYNEFLFRKADVHKIPLMGTFELTPSCNMNCEMCYIRQNGEQIKEKGGLKSLQFWEKVFDQAIENGMLFCLLTGGEIFTYPYFQELYEKICNKGIHIVLNTNGTMLNRELVSWLAKHPPRRLNISLYGNSEETYKKLCHYPEGFQRVIQTFELLNEFHIPFRVHGVLVPENIKDYEGMKQICNRFRAPLELSYYMFPPLRKETECDIKSRFSPEEMAKVAFHYRKDQCGGDGARWNEFVIGKCESMRHPEQRKYYGVNKITCRSGSSVFWVNWKGEVSGCGMDDECNYDLETVNFQEAWNQIVQYADRVPLSEECAVCCYREICPVCAAAAYCETGKMDGTPEYLCQFSQQFGKMLREEEEKIQK